MRTKDLQHGQGSPSLLPTAAGNAESEANISRAAGIPKLTVEITA
jgi:hypothetical protein